MMSRGIRAPGRARCRHAGAGRRKIRADSGLAASGMQPDAAHQRGYLLAPRAGVADGVNDQRFLDDSPDRQARIERSRRDPGRSSARAVVWPHGVPAEPADRLALETNGAARLAAPRPTIALPRVDLPQPDSPTRPTVSPDSIVRLDAIDGMDRAEPAAEVDDEILDGEQAHSRRRLRRRRKTGDPAVRRRPEASGGRSVRQMSMTFGQRGAKAQPGGNASSGGTMPGISARRSGATPPASRRGVAPSSPSRIRMQRPREQVVDRRLLDDAAGIHHHHPRRHAGDHAEIVGDQQDRHAELGLQLPQQRAGFALGSSRRARSLARRRSAPSAGTRAPSRSSRAGACRPRGDADIRRSPLAASGIRTRVSSSAACARASRRDSDRWTRNASTI